MMETLFTTHPQQHSGERPLETGSSPLRYSWQQNALMPLALIEANEKKARRLGFR